MARDVSLDLEASSPAAGLLRPPPAASPIAQERVDPGRPSLVFLVATLVLAGGTAIAVLSIGHGLPGTAAETEALDSPLAFGTGLMAGRAFAAIASSLAVAGVAVAGRRLSHSGGAGLLAAALVAADPSFLVLGQLATPAAATVALLAWTLAFVASPIPLLHWLAGLTLGAAAFLEPASALWVLPLVAFLLLRGHIYAAPQHLGLALAQVAILPLVAVAGRWILAESLAGGTMGTVPGCFAVAPWDRLALLSLVQPSPELLLIPDPVVWLAGAGAVAFLGMGAFAVALAGFRVARAPGRLQIRVVSAMPPVLARGAWLLVLALLAPPLAWLPLFAIALALGIRELGEDAPGFGLALAIALLAFAALVLVRAWGAVAGLEGGVQEALALVPWAQTAIC